MSLIEDTAIEYVKTRRAKLTAKQRRGEHMRECLSDNGGACCIYNEDLTKDEWCDDCQKANVFHEEYKTLASRCGAVLRRLERQVNTATKEGD